VKLPDVSAEQLLRWAAAATLADSYMSLVYHRGGIKDWDTPATPTSQEWQAAMTKARNASEEMAAILKTVGVDGHSIARQMDRKPWEPAVP
jgi:hypothetical protein